jgi:hypothetical protein
VLVAQDDEQEVTLPEEVTERLPEEVLETVGDWDAEMVTENVTDSVLIAETVTLLIGVKIVIVVDGELDDEDVVQVVALALNVATLLGVYDGVAVAVPEDAAVKLVVNVIELEIEASRDDELEGV